MAETATLKDPWAEMKSGRDWTPARVKALRGQTGMTLKEFAVSVGTTERTIFRWEHGDTTVSPLGGRGLAAYAVEVLTPTQLVEVVNATDDEAAVGVGEAAPA